MNELKRPWQGTVIAVFLIIGLILLGVMLTFLLMAIFSVGTFFTTLPETDASPVASLMTLLGGFFAVPIALIMVLGIFVVIGIIKGQKWAVIVSIIFSVLAILSSLSDISNQYLALIINGFLLYAEVICLKHPFYNKGKIPTETPDSTPGVPPAAPPSETPSEPPATPANQQSENHPDSRDT